MSFPEVRERGFSIPPGSELFVAVQPTTVFSTPDVVGQLPQRRKCWLPSEKKLKYHANYTQTNCLVECLSEKMEEVCGCVPYYIFKPGIYKVIRCTTSCKTVTQPNRSKIQSTVDCG